MRVALAQINSTVGDIGGNTRRILRDVEAAADQGAELVVFPELAIFGYPPKDLVLRRELVRANLDALKDIAAQSRRLAVVVGYVQPNPHGIGKGVFNAAALCRDGRVASVYAKRLLPTYDVFDESRYFDAGECVVTVEVPAGDGPLRLGLTICEDLWNDHQFEGRRVYGIDPIEQTVRAGAQVLINLSASPYRAGKHADREHIFSEQVRALGVPLVYVNQVGGNDDLIFDGAGMVLDGKGTVRARAKVFEEDLLIVNLPPSGTGLQPSITPYPERVSGIRQALVLGLRDYVRKCGFNSAVLGLSGGIDSAVTAVLAVSALGPENVHGVAMPSRFSSEHSVEDARLLAENIGIPFVVLPIEAAHQAMEELILPQFGGLPPGVAEENLQARIRGNILMALSNKFGRMLLTTGNKSELAVGYCTLYGDMCGGVAVLADVPKTVVYELARGINAEPPFPCRSAGRPLIPVRTLEKPPSAELRENQLDQDTLPPYDTLDAILERYVERYECPESIAAAGFDLATVRRIARLVDANEYKRKQSAVGLKVTSLAFGTGRRMPIAAKHR